MLLLISWIRKEKAVSGGGSSLLLIVVVADDDVGLGDWRSSTAVLGVITHF